MLLDYSPHTPTLQCSSIGLWPKCISLLRWSVLLKKQNYLPLTTGEFARIHLTIQHNTAYFPCPSSLSASTPISGFLLHHSNCIHWLLLTAPGRNNFLPSPFIVALFVSSRDLPLHSNCTVPGSTLLQTLMWYLIGPYTAYRLWIFFPFKALRVSERCVRACQTFIADYFSTVGWKTIEVSWKTIFLLLFNCIKKNLMAN